MNGNTLSPVKQFCACIFATAVSATLATAQESPANEWQGLSIGVNVSQLELANDIVFPTPALHVAPSGRETGIDLSVEYLTSFTPNILAGMELMYAHNFSDADDIAHYDSLNINISQWRVDAERSLRLLGKLAIAPSTSSLFYVGAGINKVHFSFSETTLFGVDAGTVRNHSDTLTGHVIVAGVDHRVTENLSLRVEVSHTEINEELYKGGIFRRPTWIDPDLRSLGVGIRYHF
jgi:opacity protein-like surface antigen